MRKQIPDADIAQLMLWIWIAVVLVALLLLALWRCWRKAHPPPTMPPKLAYSQMLGKRLAAGRRGVGKTKGKRGPPVSDGPRDG